MINSNECYPPSVVSSRRIIPLHCLVIFEPYAEIELTVLKNLFHSDYVQISDQVLELLCHNLSRQCNLFTGIFRLKSQSTLPSSLTPEELLTVLKQWRDGCEGTYKCLKEKLDQYSIFAGRSIVVSTYTYR